MNESDDPGRGIRAVLLAGFVSGAAAGLLYLASMGVLLEYLTQSPVAFGGAFVGVGLVGMGVGAVSGLTLKLMLGDENHGFGLYAPMLAAAITSALVVLFIANMFVAALS